MAKIQKQHVVHVSISAIVAAWNFMVRVNAGQDVQLMWASPDPTMTIESVEATNGIPAIPGLIVTVQQVG